MTFSSRALTLAALAVLLPACGGDDETKRPKNTVDILDPTVPHYGKTYEEWAGAWVQWVSDTAPPECAHPVLDATGAACALNQDPSSDVFLLAGNFGGVSIRDECVVPADKAIFLPILNISGDNAGVPEDMLISDAELREFVESNFELIDPESLRLSVDGHEIDRLERGAIPSTPYTVHLTAGANVYDCVGIDGVEGDFDGYVSGYWALLAPLEPGEHTLAFGGYSAAAPQGQPVTIDVTYELTVE